MMNKPTRSNDTVTDSEHGCHTKNAFMPAFSLGPIDYTSLQLCMQVRSGIE